MVYTKNEIISICDKAILMPELFYSVSTINAKGKTKDTNEYYTEIISEFVLDNLHRYTIPMITRQKSYKTRTHDGNQQKITNREEEIIAKEIFKQGKLGEIGTILDYQTPLKNDNSHAAGKIDLLAFDGQTVQILELKKPKSTESMLRCVLEGYTYLKTVDAKKLKQDFAIPEEVEIIARPCVFVDSIQYKEWMEPRPFLKQLMERLESKPLFIVKEQDKYKVSTVLIDSGSHNIKYI